MRLWDCRFFRFYSRMRAPSCSFHRSRPTRPQDTTARPLTPKELKKRERTQERTQRPGQGLVDGRGEAHEDERRRSWSFTRRNANNSLKSFGGIQSRPESPSTLPGKSTTVARLRRRTLAPASAGPRPTAVASTSSGVRPMKSNLSHWRHPRSSYWAGRWHYDHVSVGVVAYRHLEGIGENIEIEFVDTTGSGE